VNRYPSILVFLLVLFPLAAQAETLEFNMPGLSGPSGDPPKTASFVYVGPPVDINGVSVRFSGIVYDLGLVACWVPPGIPPYYSWWLDCEGLVWKKNAIDEGTYRDGMTHIIASLGEFDTIRDYQGEWNGGAYVGFTELEEGDVVEVELDFSMNEDYLGPAGPCSLVREASGDMATVTVILDVTIQVPVKQTTWGRIKGLY